MKKLDIKTVLTRGVNEVLPNPQNLEKLLNKKKIRVYLGIDPTGSLLTLGHAVVLKKLQQFADLGHEVILLIGNGTVRIGDPTGKDTTRPMLTDEAIAENFKNWKTQAEKVLDFDKITIKYNGDWLDKLSFSDIVKLMAKVTVPQLMERDMFQERLKKGGTVHGHEIMYPLLQGYDSVAMEVDLEIGGSDQTFNMLMGRDLLRKMKDKEKYVLSTPIINGTDGRKMSKSYGNFVALNAEPNEMFGKLMSMKDEEMEAYFEIFTDIDIEDARQKIADNPRNAKVFLAQSIVTWLHSAEEAEKALKNFEQKFVKKEIPDEMPTVQVSAPTLGILTLIAAECGFCKSNGEARRLVTQGAVTFNGQKVTDPQMEVTINGGEILQVGKRKFARLEP
ncbi:tyrosine--tRNA ligase [bacterium DOLZORAL124_38_8]|nr:MAG: tyrosine--tRNA ligase [bacterium DOLZORAL124_38_8]